MPVCIYTLKYAYYPVNPSQESRKDESTISELQRRLEVAVSLSVPELQILDELEDKEFLELASTLSGVGEKTSSDGQISHTQVVWCFIFSLLGIFN